MYYIIINDGTGPLDDVAILDIIIRRTKNAAIKKIGSLFNVGWIFKVPNSFVMKNVSIEIDMGNKALISKIIEWNGGKLVTSDFRKYMR